MCSSDTDESLAADQESVIARYRAEIDQSVLAQQTFVGSSVTSEAGYLHGLTMTQNGPGLTYNRQWGLHAEVDPLAVAKWIKMGAPVDGLWKINYGDGYEHWETPLLTALVDERVEVARALIANGANVDGASYYVDGNGVTLGHTPLHMMAARGEETSVKFLLDAGADVHRRTTDGATALALAAAEDDPGVVFLLLDAGGRPTDPDFFGRTPISRSGRRTRNLLEQKA